MKGTSKYSAEQWAQIIAEAECSGMTRKDWLELNGLTKDQYYYWVKRLKKLKQTHQVLPDIVESDSSLVAIPIAETKNGAKPDAFIPSAVIHIGNISVEISNEASAEFLNNIGRMIHNAL